MKHRILLFSAVILGVVSCTPAAIPDAQEPDVPEEPETPVEVETVTPDVPTQENGYDGILATDIEQDKVVSGDALYWENQTFGSKVTVKYAGGTASVTTSASAVKSYVTGADVALDLKGAGAVEVVAEGESTDGQLKIYGDSPVKLVLNGLKLTSAKSAVINVQNKSALYMHLADKTENSLTDASSQSDEAYYPEGVVPDDEKRNGAVYCKGFVVLSGTGVLDVTGKKKHGISVKSSFAVRPGVTLVVNDVKDNCVKAEGISVLGGYIWAKTTAVAGKCLSSDADVFVKGGALKLYTSGGSTYEEDENDTSSPAGIKADGNIVITGGDILCVSTGQGGKGLNADGNLTMDAGTVSVATSGGKYVYNSALDLDSSPKGVKADGEITINGGLMNIRVTGKSDGSEGLESKTKITINGGEVYVHSYDDAINVGGDNPVGIEINAGKVYAFADHNDGMDSNGKLWIKGGLVMASGSDAPEEGFDCDFSQNFVVTGGILIGTGGAAISTSSSSTQRSVVYNGISGKSGELLVIADAADKPILKFRFPRTISRMAVFFSSSDIKSGDTYTVYTGGTLSGSSINWNGWYEDGECAGGQKIGTFTSSSLNTTVGQGGGPGGGPGGNPPGGRPRSI